LLPISIKNSLIIHIVYIKLLIQYKTSKLVANKFSVFFIKTQKNIIFDIILLLNVGEL